MKIRFLISGVMLASFITALLTQNDKNLIAKYVEKQNYSVPQKSEDLQRAFEMCLDQADIGQTGYAFDKVMEIGNFGIVISAKSADKYVAIKVMEKYQSTCPDNQILKILKTNR